jgi:hypothetical protein
MDNADCLFFSVDADVTGKFRYDYFLIWGHGIRFRDNILDLIRSHAALKIVKILYHTPETIEQLVHAVYSYDYAPLAHLRGKTEYLKQTPNEVYFIFVENHFPDEDYLGEGPYRHIESKTIKTLKEQIRDQFNERVDLNRSEDHVVHASDNQMQTDYILKYLGHEGIDLFKSNFVALNAPYHIRGVSEFSLRKIPISSLLCRIVVGNRTIYAPRVTVIEDTPHYKALTGDDHIYEEYVRNFMGLALTDDHPLHNFLRLNESFRYLSSPFEYNYIIVKEAEEDKFVIVDGVHRAAILKYSGVTDIHVAVIKLDYQ